MADLININAAYLRDRIYTIMMRSKGFTIEKVALKIGISPFTLRRFLKNSASRYTTVMRLKILKWIESEEANNVTSEL